MEGRVAIVTGAGRGMGKSHAMTLAKRGAAVVINDIAKDKENGAVLSRSVAEEIERQGGNAAWSTDNITISEEAKNLVDLAFSTFGRLDILVNNAGIIRDAAFHKMADQQWDEVIQVHLYGTYFVTRHAWPHMREAKYGRVIMKTSISGLYGQFGQANYAAAKLGLQGMVNALAIEGKKYNILVNAVSPVAATQMNEDILNPAQRAKYRAEYVSALVAYLASESCRDTGLTIHAGGGAYSRLAVGRATGVEFEEVPTVGEIDTCWRDIIGMRECIWEPPEL